MIIPPEFNAVAPSFFVADAAMQRALRHDATLEMEAADMPHGDRQGGLRDAHGNLWWISQRLIDEPYRP